MKALQYNILLKSFHFKGLMYATSSAQNLSPKLVCVKLFANLWQVHVVFEWTFLQISFFESTLMRFFVTGLHFESESCRGGGGGGISYSDVNTQKDDWMIILWTEKLELTWHTIKDLKGHCTR